MKSSIPRIIRKHRQLLQVLLMQVIRCDLYPEIPHTVLKLERCDIMSDITYKLYSINVVRPDIRSLSLHQQKLYFASADESFYNTPNIYVARSYSFILVRFR